MKKAAIALALILVAAVAAPAAVRVSLIGGYASALEWKAAQEFGVSAAAELDLADFLAVGARFTLSSVPIPAVTTSSGLSQGRLTLVPAVLFLQFRWPGKGRFKPYLAAGGGYSFNSHSLAAEAIDGWDAVGFSIEERLGNTGVVYAGAGFDLSVGPRLFFNFHTQIIISPLSGTWTLTDTDSGFTKAGDLSGTNGLNSLVAGIGLKYQF